jgi:hypothetical protein
LLLLLLLVREAPRESPHPRNTPSKLLLLVRLVHTVLLLLLLWLLLLWLLLLWEPTNPWHAQALPRHLRIIPHRLTVP